MTDISDSLCLSLARNIVINDLPPGKLGSASTYLIDRERRRGKSTLVVFMLKGEVGKVTLSLSVHDSAKLINA